MITKRDEGGERMERGQEGAEKERETNFCEFAYECHHEIN